MTQTLVVYVNDQKGNGLSGAEVSFSVPGETNPAVVVSANGQASYIYSGDPYDVTVSAKYDGETKHGIISKLSTVFTFKFNVEQDTSNGEKPPVNPLYGFVIGIVLLAVATFMAYRLVQFPPDSESGVGFLRFLILALFSLGAGGFVSSFVGQTTGNFSLTKAIQIAAGGAFVVFFALMFLGKDLLRPVHEADILPPTLSRPFDNTFFENFPRTTTLVWLPSENAESYQVEVQYELPESGKWHDLPKYPVAVAEPSYTFEFPGSQRGRWRIYSVGEQGNKSDPSKWWYFTYK